jgi:hypothetical protein
MGGTGARNRSTRQIGSIISLVMIQRVYSHLTPADDYAALMQVLRAEG